MVSIFHDWSGSREEHKEHERENERNHSNRQETITHVLNPHTHGEIHDPKSTKDDTNDS